MALDNELGRYSRAFRPFKQTEWTFWPINYGGNHWELVIIHKEQVNGEWSHIVQIAVIDAWRNSTDSTRRRVVNRRVKGLMKKLKFTFGQNIERTVWVPWQKDGWSCGLRTYWAARRIIERILKLEEEGLNYDEEVWLPLSGWFNPDFVRWEMIGLNAYDCVKDLGYRARIAVELVNEVDSGAGVLVDAATVMRPPRNAGDDKIEKPPEPPEPEPEKPGQAKRRVLVPVPVPNQRRIAPSWPIERRNYKPFEKKGEHDDPVWSRTSTGKRRLLSQDGAPNPKRPNLFSGENG
ncbi:hypothetical protein F5Y06DRAFT_265209 [Hypoxylon sp. FL0890]|nr:hypothetical protein F5Y06DRAFT_265209 [Hypoxylon sp. FL0890]